MIIGIQIIVFIRLCWWKLKKLEIIYELEAEENLIRRKKLREEDLAMNRNSTVEEVREFIPGNLSEQQTT